jgi:hypothetical protein
MKSDSMLFVDAANEFADRRTEHPRQRHGVDTDDINFDFPRAQRGCRLQADEARADDHGPYTFPGLFHDCARIGECSEHVNVSGIRTGNLQPAWVRASGEQQRAIAELLAALASQSTAAGVDAVCAIVHRKVDVHLTIKRRVTQRYPLLGRVAREVILREVRPVDRARQFVSDQ